MERQNFVGAGILPGGDLYEQKKRFFDLVSSRPEDTVEDWAKSLLCPVIRVDGTKPAAENAAHILDLIQNGFSP